MITVLRKLPWWVWAALVLTVVIGAKEWRDGRRIAELQRKVDEAEVKAIAGAKAAAVKAAAEQRAASAADLARLTTERRAISSQVAELKRSMTALETKSRELAADLGRREVAHRALVETGTVDEILAAARALGYHPRAVPRLR